MKKVFPLIVFLSLIILSCEEENDINAINDQWTEIDQSLKNKNTVIQEILFKYNAVGYQINEKSLADDNARPSDMVKLFNSNKMEITNIAEADLVRFIATYKEMQTQKDQMSKLSDVDGVYTIVDEQPQPEGGIEALYKYIATNLKYPEQARKMGIEGKVFVQFIVNEFGEITEVETIKGIGAGCDAEAVRILKESVDWKPGRLKDKAVKVRMVIPITYKLN